MTEESAEMLEIMSQINYIVGKDGYEGTIAPFWRLRVCSHNVCMNEREI